MLGGFSLRVPRLLVSPIITKSEQTNSKHLWTVTKQQCCLSQEEITSAKALELNPRKLIAN